MAFLVQVLMSDNFDDNSIDTGKWTETDGSGRISETNQRIELNTNHSSTIAELVNNLKTISSVASGVANVQAIIDWTDDGVNEAIGGIYLGSDTSNFASITSRSSGGTYRIRIFTGGSQQYSLETSITNNVEAKIEYNTSTNEVKFYYWNGSAWTQMGTTQTLNIGSTVFGYISFTDSTTFVNGDLIVVNNFYLTKGSYTTQIPVDIFAAEDASSMLLAF